MASPVIPPRPQRAQPGPTAVPQVPARPSRRTDPSPARDMARSPLNDLPGPHVGQGHAFYGSSNLSASELPRRPPSVAEMPSIGQEGNEYASYDQLPPEAQLKDDAHQTRHANVPMLAPTASIPSSTAKSRISAVTRTDSSPAASEPKEEEPDTLRRVTSREPHPLRNKTSFSRSTQSLHSNSTPRPPSVHSVDGFEHGIPVIGQTVPMYPNAGDVQAPSPGPTHAMFPAGVGFFNDGSNRAHQRRRSSRQEFGPPGSYGLHGHPGQQPGDQFEREWIAKHPDIAAREGYNVYGGLEPRPASALTSEQLNRLVGESDDVGFRTDRKMISTPDQEIGYIASEMYAKRSTSAKPSPSFQDPSAPAGTQAEGQSPYRKSFPFSQSGDHALESEDDTFHVDPPEVRGSRITGGMPADGAIDLGPRAGNTAEAGGWFNELGHGIPILASDQTSKRPGSAYLQPAVNPEARDDDDAGSRRGSTHGSRPPSRPSSTHGHHALGGPLARFISHEEHHGSGGGTPLEEIEEYEPLFPDEDGKNMSQLLKEKLKQQRPSLAAHHFPSQDVWEDTPESLQYTTDVDTPEPARVRAAAVFETPEQEQMRRAQNPDDMTSDAKTFAKPHFRGAQREFERPGVQRFPSQDVWEDTPDSMRLETTVSGPQMDETLGHPEERPTTSALPQDQDQGDARATTGLTQLMKQSGPVASSRPHSRSKLSQDITSEVSQDDPRSAEVPDLGATSSKPVIPARPAKFTRPEQADAPPAPKAKPAVPARPAGNKLAGMRANFMNDLNSRLQLGPQAPPTRSIEPEAEAPEEKTPLVDARKSRAKGPSRRKPAHSAPEAFGFSFSSMTLWHIDEEDELKIGVSSDEKAAANKEMSVNEEVNLEKSPPVQAESGFTEEAIGHHGDLPDPSISPAVVSEARAVQPELEKALATAEPAPVSAEALHAKDAAHGGLMHDSGSLASAAAPLQVKAPEEGNVAIRDGEEVGRTD
ncbi:hypothetical protein AMS68_000695 [Peltaster fructicola]|uniref:Altered inheritance of mitochondria protein 21 n=1 Tax=Peltaster fructicola TaxID=286661 RepID=A0A6H0XKL6_9PEZI|nr:hypothetical protein AMS68_000695 [Peltaster fructicola]